MADDDDVDIVGEFSGDITLSSASTYDEMGLTINELLPYLGSNSWLMNSDQVWFMDSTVEDKANKTSVVEDTKAASSIGSSEKECLMSVSSQKNHKKQWSKEEKEQFKKGLDIYGNRWSKISKQIGTRTTLQVKNYARQQQQKQKSKNVGEVNSPSKIEAESTSISDNLAYETASPTVQIRSKRNKNVSPPRNESEKRPVGHKVPLVHSKEVIRINKEEESGESEDVDVEDVIESKDYELKSNEKISSSPTLDADNVNSTIGECSESLAVSQDTTEDDNNQTNVLTGSSDVIREQRVFTFQIPDEELVFDRDMILEEERSIHQEFFEGRPRKNPERYLKIRNFILDSWEKSKPSYLNKTSIRPGLKHCGDVNCIGRIHSYLELTGAINFGCEQTVYDRSLVLSGKPIPMLKRGNQECVFSQKLARIETMRPRKHKFPVLTFNSEAGGYTIVHDENGLVVDVAEGLEPVAAPSVKRLKSVNNNPFRLINCSEFNLNNPAPFSVVVDVGALIIMDIHAHLSDLEVIGLLGGRYDRECSVLYVSTAEPCESLSTGLECEMDPVSQTQASEKLQQSGYSVVGWYHSHPTFSPNPSFRDLETQSKFQEWFGQGGSPFLGVIVSPHHLTTTTASKVRYLVVGDESVEDGHRKPYKFLPSYTPLSHRFDIVLVDAEKLIRKWMPSVLSSDASLQSTLSMMNKMISSIHYHLTSTQEGQSTTLSFLSELAKIIVIHLPGTTESQGSHDISTDKT